MRAIIQNQISCRVLIHGRYNTTVIVDPLSSMASAFDVKSNCSRSSVGAQSLNNLPAQFPSTSFTVFAIGSALDFGAFLSETRARLVCGGVRFADQGIWLLDPFLLASGEHKFIYIPGNILNKEKKSRGQATNQRLHFAMSCVDFGNSMKIFIPDASNSRRVFGHIWSKFCIQINSRAW